MLGPGNSTVPLNIFLIEVYSKQNTGFPINCVYLAHFGLWISKNFRKSVNPKSARSLSKFDPLFVIVPHHYCHPALTRNLFCEKESAYNTLELKWWVHADRPTTKRVLT